MTYTCSSCNDSYTQETAANNHSIRNVSAKAPTCTQSGYKAYEYCVNCSYSTYKEIAPNGHSYSSKVTAPTCTEKGYTTYNCPGCGHNYKDDFTSASGHSYGFWSTEKEATCTEKGIEKRACSVCRTTETRYTEKTSHDFDTKTFAPDCINKGYTVYNCKECGLTYTDNYIPAVNHTDRDNDSICDTCEEQIPAKKCDCMCHKSGFMGFIYKIVQIFWKLFKINPKCSCGVSHY